VINFRVAMTQTIRVVITVAYTAACDIEGDRLGTRQEFAADNNAVAKQFMKYGEYLTVEIDTEAKTATVVPHGG
jgi:hypothetical protein